MTEEETEEEKKEVIEGAEEILDQEATTDQKHDEFARDVERLRQMKQQQMKKLQEAKRMVEKLERSLTKINGQLEFIQYRRNKAEKEGDEVE